MKKKRPIRTRTLRRNLERSADRLAQARRKLVLLEDGGTPERPIAVESAAVVEARAESVPCPDCGSALRTIEHNVIEHEGQLLRAVKLECRSCGAPLEQFFRIAVVRPN